MSGFSKRLLIRLGGGTLVVLSLCAAAAMYLGPDPDKAVRVCWASMTLAIALFFIANFINDVPEQ